MKIQDGHTFAFDFYNREQFYDIVRMLNSECGHGNWTIRGKVLKNLKYKEELAKLYTMIPESKFSITKDIVVPHEYQHLEALLRLKYN